VLKHRVIPCLLVEHGGLVKTRRFSDRTYVGDPMNAIRIFNGKEVDELMVLDIAASRESAEPNYEMIAQFAGECFMPVGYGGGIRSVEQARRIFALGIEKVCVQSAALERPELISELAGEFGRQSIVVSIDVQEDWLGRKKLYQSRSRKTLPTDWREFLDGAVRRGAGEIMVNSVKRDGTMSGFDLDLIAEAAQRVEVPVIAVGGAGKLADFRHAVDAGAAAVAAGSMFVFQGPHRAVLISYPDYADLERLFEATL
jgi:cyclase